MSDETNTTAAPAAPAAPAQNDQATQGATTGQQPAEGQPKPVDATAKPTGEQAAKPTEAAKPEPKAPRDTAARVELRKAQAELAAARAESAAAKKELEGLAKLKGAAANAKEDALAALEALGLTMEDVVKAGTKGERVDPMAKQALAKAAALEKQLADEKAAATKRAEDARQAEDEAKGRAHVVKELEAGGDKYELTRHAGDEGIAAVTAAAAAYHEIHGVFPTLEQAMVATEAQYEARLKAQLGTKRAAGLLPKTGEVKPGDGAKASDSKTITGDLSSGRGAPAVRPPEEAADKTLFGAGKAARRAADRADLQRDAQSALKRS